MFELLRSWWSLPFFWYAGKKRAEIPAYYSASVSSMSSFLLFAAAIIFFFLLLFVGGVVVVVVFFKLFYFFIFINIIYYYYYDYLLLLLWLFFHLWSLMYSLSASAEYEHISSLNYHASCGCGWWHRVLDQHVPDRYRKKSHAVGMSVL